MIWNGPEQSLIHILDAREQRATFQQKWSELFGQPVIAFKLNIPGPVKSSEGIIKMFQEGVAAFHTALLDSGVAVAYEKYIYENSGPEYFAICATPPKDVKALTIKIENEHPLGRLFDFDVIGENGEAISRQDLGQTERKCLICDQPAFVCGRARQHGLEALKEKIEQCYTAYFENCQPMGVSNERSES